MGRARCRLIMSVLVIATAVAVLAGCGSSSDNNGGGASAQADKLRFLVISHGPATDPNFAYLANGVKHAGEDLGISVEYRGTKAPGTDPNGQRRLIESAIATKPDGMVVTNPYPEVLNRAIKQASDAGIPVVLMNDGIDQTQETGALTVVANDERQSGVLGGEQMRRLGVKHPLVVTIPLGTIPAGDARSEGFVEGYGATVDRLDLPVNKVADQQFVKNAIEARLEKDSSIDGVFGTGSGFAAAIIASQSAIGSRAQEITWGAIDVPRIVIDAMKAGTFDFALDQQQFAQPYLAIAHLNLFVKYGITPASDFIPTGPALVTKENVDRIAELEAANAG